MVVLNFDRTNRVIIVDTATTLDLQDLYNQCKDKEDDPEYMDEPIICTATGKQVLTAVVKVAITLQMENGWTLGFKARAGPAFTLCFIEGGNIVSSDEVVGNWIEDTAFVQINYGASSSATLVSSGGVALTSQQTRDAMQLAPTSTTATGSIDEMLVELYQTNRGGWTIDQVTNEMIFFEDDNTTELFRTALFDKDGNPTALGDVFKRTKV